MPGDNGKYSKREKEIAHLLEKGLSKKLIAAQLGNSHNTVRTEISRMYLKAHVHSATQFVHQMHQHPEEF